MSSAPLRPDDQMGMERALEVARDAVARGEVPVGAAVVVGAVVSFDDEHAATRSIDAPKTIPHLMVVPSLSADQLANEPIGGQTFQ